MKALISVLVLTVAIGLGVWSYFAPQLTIGKIQDAAESGDRDALRELVDFAAVRESLKEQIKPRFAKKMLQTQAELRGNPFAAFGSVLAMAVFEPMLDTMIDSFVTPEGIAGATRGQPKAKPSPPRGTKTETPSKKGYDGPSKYELNFYERGTMKPSGGVVLRRNGLFSWRLVELRLPDSLFDDGPGSDVDAARRTMHEIRVLAIGLERYAADHKSYPPPDGLEQALVPRYSGMMVRADGWGRTLRILISEDRQHYTVISPGSDGAFDERLDLGLRGPSPVFADDIVYRDGAFVRWPAQVPPD